MATTMISMTLIMVLVPLAAHNLHLDGVVVGVLVAVPSMVQIATTLPAGAACDRFGRRPLLAVGGAVASSGALILVVSNGLPALVAGSALYGAGSSLASSAALTALAEQPPHRIARVQGLNAAAQRGGALVAALIVTAGVGTSGTLGFVPVLMATALLGGLAVWARSGGVGRSGGAWLGPSFRRGGALLVRRSEIQVSALYSVLMSLLLTVGTSFTPLMLVRDFHADPAVAGALLVARDLGAALISPAMGWWAQRVGPQRMQAAGLAAGLVGLAGMLVAPPGWALFACFACQGVALAGSLVCTNLWGARGSRPTERALALATGGYVGRIASFAVPVLLGRLFDASSPAMLLGACTLWTLSSLLILWRSTTHSSLDE